MNQLQFINTTPEQLAKLINEGVKAQFLEFSKHFTPSDPDVLLSREDTCKLLQIDSSTLWSYTNKGKLICYGLGHRRYYMRSEVLKALQPLKK